MTVSVTVGKKGPQGIGTTRARLGCAEGQTHTRTPIHICTLLKDRNILIYVFHAIYKFKHIAMYVCVCVCVRVCMCAYVCVYVCVCMYVCV